MKPLYEPYPEKQICYTIPESIRILRISRSSLNRLRDAGKIKVTRVGGRQLIAHKELERIAEKGA